MAIENYLIVEIFALVFWSFQLAPQVVENWRRKSTVGLSPYLLISWTIGSLCTAIYNIGGSVGGRYSFLFIVQPNLFMVFSVTCWSQCFYYERQGLQGTLYGCGLIAILAGIEAVGGYFLTLHASLQWPFTLLGVMSLVFFAIGFIPQYYEFYLTKRVDGISLLFLAIDMLGAVLSIVSLAMQSSFDPISGACYIVVFVLDLLIVVLHYLLPVLYKSVETAEITTERQVGGSMVIDKI